MPDPYKDLAGAIDTRTQQQIQAALCGLRAELGRITASGLKLDGFAHEIRDYRVSVHLRLPDNLGPDSGGDTLATPSDLRALRPGDRVLVIPVNQGQDHVVIARVGDAKSPSG